MGPKLSKKKKKTRSLEPVSASLRDANILQIIVTNQCNDEDLVKDFMASMWNSCRSDVSLLQKSRYLCDREFVYYVGTSDELLDQDTLATIAPPNLRHNNDENVVVDGKTLESNVSQNKPVDIFLSCLLDGAESDTSSADLIADCVIFLYDAKAKPNKPVDYESYSNRQIATMQEIERIYDSLRGLGSFSRHMSYASFVRHTTLFLAIGVDNKSDVNPSDTEWSFPFQNNAARRAEWDNEVVKKFGDRLMFPIPIEIALGSEAQRGAHWYPTAHANASLLSSHCSFSGICSENQFNGHNLAHCYFLTFVLLSYSHQLGNLRDMNHISDDVPNSLATEPLYIPRDITRFVLQLCYSLREAFSMRNLIVFLAEACLNRRRLYNNRGRLELL
jgi:hypothetical protein